MLAGDGAIDYLIERASRRRRLRRVSSALIYDRTGRSVLRRLCRWPYRRIRLRQWRSLVLAAWLLRRAQRRANNQQRPCSYVHPNVGFHAATPRSGDRFLKIPTRGPNTSVETQL